MRHETIEVCDEVRRERERQVLEEGFTPQHDDQEHADDDLAQAAACYALAGLGWGDASVTADLWPWDTKYWKPSGGRRDLVRAAALLVAEIERLDRKAAAGA